MQHNVRYYLRLKEYLRKNSLKLKAYRMKKLLKLWQKV